jgi:phosphomannomutase
MTKLRNTLNYDPVELGFGTSGLRGLVTDMTDLECYINALGFLTFLKESQNQEIGQTIYLAGDLRDSTPRILRAVAQAIADSGFVIEYCGLVPTPTVAFYALQNNAPCIMVTGSHIPADRNGIKFYKQDGEVLKDDEVAIKDAVAGVRLQAYEHDSVQAVFDENGMLRIPPELPEATPSARDLYIQRYTSVFGPTTFAGKEIVFYQHSAVGRDLLVEILQKLGATVTPVGRSDVFVPIDTENVRPSDQAYFKQLAAEHPGAFAIASTDGDSDRPFVIDTTGTFHRGDVLGAVVADQLRADFVGLPVSSSDAVTTYLDSKNVAWEHTKIGSPYVIKAMQAAKRAGKQRVVGWEVNGGFLLGADISFADGTLQALPTRDALLPIIMALYAAAASNTNVADVFAVLPARFSQAGLIDNFPTEVSKEIVARFSEDSTENRTALGTYFSLEKGFGAITEINTVDGIRIFFDNGDIAHMRPSGNAPQLRIYSVSATQERADEIVNMALAEPDGIFRTMQKNLQA